MTTATAVSRISQQMRRAIDDCLDCAGICQESVDYCLHMGGRHAESNHIKLLIDCGEICQTAANYMLRSSEFYRQICSLCADVSNRCAQSCEQFGDDQQMKACAEVCRRTAQSCQQMGAMRM